LILGSSRLRKEVLVRHEAEFFECGVAGGTSVEAVRDELGSGSVRVAVVPLDGIERPSTISLGNSVETNSRGDSRISQPVPFPRSRSMPSTFTTTGVSEQPRDPGEDAVCGLQMSNRHRIVLAEGVQHCDMFVWYDVGPCISGRVGRKP